MRAAWSEHEGASCLCLIGCPPLLAGSARVVPTELVDGEAEVAPGTLPSMAARVDVERDRAWIVPQFPFVPGTSYTVLFPGLPSDRLTISYPGPRHDRTTTVVEIYPTSPTVPYNLLKLYVEFTAPMSEGLADRYVRVVDDRSGERLVDPFLPTGEELWDRARRCLTLLFDPARIKRGLVPHQVAGYPLRPDRAVRVEVDGGYLDARGMPLSGGFVRRYSIGADERRHVDPAAWQVAPPAPGVTEPVVVELTRPLDHALLQWCITVAGPDGRQVPGRAAIGRLERSWAYVPDHPWAGGTHQLVVDPRLEDLAGNSLARVFDRDLTRPQDAPRPSAPVVVPFTVR